MKKLFLITFIFLGLGLGTVGIIHSQAFDYNRAYQDYIYNLGLYKTAFSEYEFARSQYLISKTLAAQSKAQEATAKMLIARDEVVRTYLTALRLKIKETPGFSAADQEARFTQIDEDVKWFTDHKARISSAATLEDQVADSDEARVRYEENTLIVIYQSLLAIGNAKLGSNRIDLEKIVSEIRVKISEIRGNNDKNTAIVERWLLEAENRIVRSNEKESEAKGILAKMKPSDDNKLSLYSDAVFRLSEALQYLKEGKSYLDQIIREIKLAD